MLKLFIALFSIISTKALANPACAVCTVAVGASLEVARRLGVDDSVVGVWSGAMLALVGFWSLSWFDKKNWHFKGRNFIVVSASVLMILFIYISQMVYTPKAILIFWIDPFLFSTIIGALVFVLSSDFYQWMKKKNGGRAHFPFEKVVVPVIALSITAYFFSCSELCKIEL